jgi:pimeloyl-ACP methyl ester carboxylesterase
LAADAIAAVGANAGRLPALAAAPFPVHLIWGAHDPDLNVGVAEALRDSLPGAELDVLPGAHHNLQIDEPTALARLLRRPVSPPS